MHKVEINVSEKFTGKVVITASYKGSHDYVSVKAGFVATRFSRATHNVRVEFTTI